MPFDSALPDVNYLPEPEQPFREMLCLNGPWQFQPVPDHLPAPDPGAWSEVPIRVPSPWNVNAFAGGGGGDFRCFPSYPAEWESAGAGWYRRHLVIRQRWSGKRICLLFEAVHYMCEVYLNGHKVGEHEGGFTPFELDATEDARIGRENELLVGVKGIRPFEENGRRPFPFGSFWGDKIAGIWQDVYLVARPRLSIEDLFVSSFVRKGTLRVRVRLRNATDRAARHLSVRLRMENADGSPTAGPSFPEMSLRLAAGEEREMGVEVPWADPLLWWPDRPHLYRIVAELLCDGKMTDLRTERFGFREFWIEGRGFYLNGTRIKLRGDAWQFMGIPQLFEEYPRQWYRMAKEAGANIIRLHAQVYPRFYLDIADEMGMLIIDESAIWASACNFQYNERFWERARQHVREMVLRDRNHPSVVLWSVANETFGAHHVQPNDGAESLDWLMAKVYELTLAMRELDDTRPISSDGDHDLGGPAEIFSCHSPTTQSPASPANSPSRPITLAETGSMYYYYPDAVAA